MNDCIEQDGKIYVEVDYLNMAKNSARERGIENAALRTRVTELEARLATATAMRDALRTAVIDTPHDNRCRTRVINAYPSEDRKPGRCNCWKDEVWLREKAAGESACDSVAVGGSIVDGTERVNHCNDCGHQLGSGKCKPQCTRARLEDWETGRTK